MGARQGKFKHKPDRSAEERYLNFLTWVVRHCSRAVGGGRMLADTQLADILHNRLPSCSYQLIKDTDTLALWVLTGIKVGGWEAKRRQASTWSNQIWLASIPVHTNQSAGLSAWLDSCCGRCLICSCGWYCISTLNSIKVVAVVVFIFVVDPHSCCRGFFAIRPVLKIFCLWLIFWGSLPRRQIHLYYYQRITQQLKYFTFGLDHCLKVYSHFILCSGPSFNILRGILGSQFYCSLIGAVAFLQVDYQHCTSYLIFAMVGRKQHSRTKHRNTWE